MVSLTQSDLNRFQYRDWISYFEENDAKRLKIDFSEEIPLSEDVQKNVFPSIRAFQKGEGSDGRFLLGAVDRYVENGGPMEYRQAMLLFVKEENWHSAYLKAYMDYYGVPSAKRSLLDAAFRKLRHMGGIKCEVTVLVTAEIIALTYYDALSNCSDSKALKQICKQMLDDEAPHVIFQSYTLSRLKSNGLDRFFRRLIMNVTLLFVWCAFHKPYQMGGYGFLRFMRENNENLQQSILLSQR